MATYPHAVIELDSQRPSLIEHAFTCVRTSDQFPAQNLPNSRVFRWKTGTFTLKPVNLTTDFIETNKYETLKFRLADVLCPQDFFTEVPQNFKYQGQKNDYFFNCVVPSASTPPPGPSGSLVGQLLEVLNYDARLTLVNTVNFQSQFGVSVMRSKHDFPKNQGYQIRWRFDIEGGQESAAAMQFVFGDFCLVFNTDNTFDIYQTADYKHWRYWTSFSFGAISAKGEIQTMTIFPHARNKIEFIVGGGVQWQVEKGAISIDYGKWVHSTDRSFIFTCPWDTREPKDGSYTITDKGPWTVICSKFVRPFFQVSRLGFYNGSAVPAVVYDDPYHIGYFPKAEPTYTMNYDLNGCDSKTAVVGSLLSYDFSTLAPPIQFSTTSPPCEFFVFGLALTGIGDIPASQPQIAPMSSVSPEFYGYQVDKKAVFTPSVLTPTTFEVIEIASDTGSGLENESLIVTVLNDVGQASAYQNRGHIPCRLLDDYYGITLFEGTVHKVESFEASSTVAPHLRLSIRSMADGLLLNRPFALDFSMASVDGNAWTWQDALRRCAEDGGIQPERVIFEGTGPTGDPKSPWKYPGSAYNFPLWNAIDAGGAVSGGIKSDSKQDVARWKPNPNTPILSFYDSLCRNTLGWHYVWDKATSRLINYKRPRPKDITFTQAKAAFFSNLAELQVWQAANPTVPCYLHRSIQRDTERPQCTTIRACGYFPVRGLKNRDDLQKLLQQPQLDGPSIEDSAYETVNRFVTFDFDNPKGYVHSDGTYTLGPDFMSDRIVRTMNLTSAGSIEAFQWLGRRVFEDQCFGNRWATFEADWGDPYNYNFRKWDLILIDPDPSDQTSGWYLFDRAEPQWGNGSSPMTVERIAGQPILISSARKARYRASEYRADAAPPR